MWLQQEIRQTLASNAEKWDTTQGIAQNGIQTTNTIEQLT